MLKLQGMDPHSIKQVVSDKEFGQQIGNAMSVNVIERVLIHALQAGGLVPKDQLHDRWMEGERLRADDDLTIDAEQSAAGDGRLPDKRFIGKFLGASDRGVQIIVDTGASFHCWNILDLYDDELRTKRKVAKPFKINTANGPVAVEWEADVYIESLGIWITAFLLPHTPPLLSVGMLCSKAGGFHFVWENDEEPFLQKEFR